MTVTELRNRVRVALGEAPASVVIRGGRVVDVFTGNIEETDVLIAGDYIAAVGPAPKGAIGPDTQIIDAQGAYVVPALIDPHFHAGGTHLAVAELAEALFTRGTTTIATDFQEFYVVNGRDGVRFALDQAKAAGLNVLYMIPMQMFVVRHLGTAGTPMDKQSVLEMIEWPEAKGINEPPLARLLEDDDAMEIVAKALSKGLLFPGHAVGLNPNELNAYAAIGASSCHESMTAEQVTEKLARGLKPLMRHGSAAPDLVHVLPAVVNHPDRLRWASMCSDEVDPVDMVEFGGMDYKIRLAVQQGVNPMDALRMATINPAEYYRVDHELGSVSPGKRADIVLTGSLEEFRAWQVLRSGELVAKDGKMLVQLKSDPYPEFLRGKVNLDKTPTADTFRLAVPDTARAAVVRVIGVHDGSLVSDALEAELPVRDGRIESNAEADVIKFAVMDRHTASGRIAISFVSGFGLRRGAIAGTYIHPFYQLAVLGVSDEAMAIAARAVQEMGGGLAVYDGEEIVRWPLPIVGIYEAKPLHEVQRDFRKINDAIKGLGCPLSAPVLAFSFLALQTIPTYGLSDFGLFDIRINQYVEPILELK